MRWAVVARVVDLVLPGLFAWGVTVAWPVFVRPSASLPRALAVAAPVALLSGAASSTHWPAIARALGIWCFFALCAAVWASSRILATGSSIDPVQGIAGSLGWALFAIGWAREAGPIRADVGPAAPTAADGRLAGDDPRAGPKPPPRRPVTWLAAFSIAAAAALLTLAFWVPGRARASFAHAVAVAGSVALVGAASEISGRARPGAPDRARNRLAAAWRERLGGAKASLILLAVLALLGAAYVSTR
jgi:hypothetical protein